MVHQFQEKTEMTGEENACLQHDVHLPVPGTNAVLHDKTHVVKGLEAERLCCSVHAQAHGMMCCCKGTRRGDQKQKRKWCESRSRGWGDVTASSADGGCGHEPRNLGGLWKLEMQDEAFFLAPPKSLWTCFRLLSSRTMKTNSQHLKAVYGGLLWRRLIRVGRKKIFHLLIMIPSPSVVSLRFLAISLEGELFICK